MVLQKEIEKNKQEEEIEAEKWQKEPEKLKPQEVMDNSKPYTFDVSLDELYAHSWMWLLSLSPT